MKSPYIDIKLIVYIDIKLAFVWGGVNHTLGYTRNEANTWGLVESANNTA
jgi:hypothetical protein